MSRSARQRKKPQPRRKAAIPDKITISTSIRASLFRKVGEEYENAYSAAECGMSMTVDVEGDSQTTIEKYQDVLSTLVHRQIQRDAEKMGLVPITQNRNSHGAMPDFEETSPKDKASEKVDLEAL